MFFIDIFKFILQIIITPMALAGIALGIYIMYNFNSDFIQQIITYPETYALHIAGAVWLFALLYALLFNHVYKIDGRKIDWWATFTSSFWHFCVICAMAALTCVIYWAANTNWAKNIDRYARNQRVQDTFTPSQIYNRQ